MDKKLLSYYNEEILYLRNGISEFSKTYPHIATSLNLNSRTNEDPHITRLLEAFSLISGRIRYSQDNNFNELNITLLESLFPHYSAPIPSMAIVQFQPNSSLKKTEYINRGEQLETLPLNGDPLPFVTCYDTELLPLQVDKLIVAKMLENSFSFKNQSGAQIVVQLSTLDQNNSLHDSGISKIRFHINSAEDQGAFLYELFIANCLGLSIVDPVSGQLIGTIESNKIQPVGMAENESIIPFMTNAPPHWRLLSEYFTFREKFMFFDLELSQDLLFRLKNSIQLCFHFSKEIPATIHDLKKETLEINCVPAINLLRKNLEPTLIDGSHYEFKLVADKRHPNFYEIHTIEKVTDVSNPMLPQEIYGLYTHRHNKEQSQLWAVKRKFNTIDSHNSSTMYISLTENTEQLNREHSILDIEATCYNGDLPSRLYLPNNVFHLQMSQSKASLEGIRFLNKPTKPLKRIHNQTNEGSGFITQLVSNSLVLTNKESAFNYLKAVLHACNVSQTQVNDTIIDSVINVNPVRILTRTSDSMLSPFVYGVKMVVSLKEEPAFTFSKKLFTSILQKSFSLTAYVNHVLEWEFTTNSL